MWFVFLSSVGPLKYLLNDIPVAAEKQWVWPWKAASTSTLYAFFSSQMVLILKITAHLSHISDQIWIGINPSSGKVLL